MTLFDALEAHKNNPGDKRVFGLVVQGGGMRAVYSAGALVPLVEYGFTEVFQHVVGASAGAINGTYFMDSQTSAIDAYIDDLSSKQFVNLLRKDKKVDIDYLVDDVLQPKHTLNLDRLAKSPSQLHVLLTDARNGKSVVISDHHKFARIYEEFRATAALPVLYDKTVEIDGREYIDGGVANLIPVDVAIKLGCTDIVVVLTQQIKSYRFDKKHDRLVRHLFQKLAKNNPPSVRKQLPTNEKVLQANLRLLKAPGKQVRVYVLEPSSEEELIGTATADRDKVSAFAMLGVVDMDTFLQKQLSL